jgi:hypothetical protein
VASEGRSDAVAAMRLDLEVRLAPALGSLLQTADVASCGQTAQPTHQRAGLSKDSEAPSTTHRDLLPAALGGQAKPAHSGDLTDAMAS